MQCLPILKVNSLFIQGINYYFTDGVLAIYDVWFVGDQFFATNFGELQKMHQTARIKKKSPPYLYEYYNMFGYYSAGSSGRKHVIGRMINALLVGLNTHNWLPRYVIVVFDKDLIDDVNIF